MSKRPVPAKTKEFIMEYTKLGNTDIEISRLCLGCMSLGDASKGMHTWAVPYEESKAIIGYA